MNGANHLYTKGLNFTHMKQIENRMVVDSEWKPHIKPIYHCCECERGIYPEDAYYDVFGDVVCENCSDSYFKKKFRRWA